MAYGGGNARRHNVAVHGDANRLAGGKTWPGNGRQRQRPRRNDNAARRPAQRLLPGNPHPGGAGAGGVGGALGAVGDAAGLRQRRPRPDFLKPFYQCAIRRQSRPVRRNIVQQQRAGRRAGKGFAGDMHRYQPPLRRRVGQLGVQLPPLLAGAEFRRQRTQLQIAICPAGVGDARPESVAGQRSGAATAAVGPAGLYGNAVGAGGQRYAGRLRIQSAAQRRQQRVQIGRIAAGEGITPPRRRRKSQRVNAQRRAALHWPVQESHRLADDRRHCRYSVNGVQLGYPRVGRAPAETRIVQRHIAADAVPGLVGFAAGQRRLERAGEHAQRRRQGYDDRQRGVRQRAAGHLPQR